MSYMMGRDPEEERLEQEAKAAVALRVKAKRATMANVCYDQFFKYFQFAEINWMSKEFYTITGGIDAIPKEGVFAVTEKWLEHRWSGPGRSLETLKVQEDLAEEVAGKASVDLGADNLSFADTVRFIFHFQHCHLMREKTAGFTQDDISVYQDTFERHCMGQNNAKATELWKILRDLGFEFPTLEDQQYIIDLVKDSDADKSGTIDFEELLNLLRTIIDDEKIKTRERENAMIMKSKMAYEECDQWIDVFLATAGDSGAIRLHDVRDLFEGLELKWGPDGSKKLMHWLREVDEDCNGQIDFGEFCCLVQKMWDENFGEIKSKVGDAIRSAEDSAAASQGSGDNSEAAKVAQPQYRRRASWMEHVSDKVDEDLDPHSPKSQRMIKKLEEALTH